MAVGLSLTALQTDIPGEDHAHGWGAALVVKRFASTGAHRGDRQSVDTWRITVAATIIVTGSTIASGPDIQNSLPLKKKKNIFL